MLESELCAHCEALIFAIRQIVAKWESGDLAGAVNVARESADAAEDFIVNQCGVE